MSEEEYKNILDKLYQKSICVNAGGKGCYSSYANEKEWSDDIDLALEYITKLEQEIERLNKSLEEQRHFYLDQLQQKENIIKEVREYIETLRNYRFNVDLGENREQLEIVGSTENFIKDILEILDKGE